MIAPKARIYPSAACGRTQDCFRIYAGLNAGFARHHFASARRFGKNASWRKNATSWLKKTRPRKQTCPRAIRPAPCSLLWRRLGGARRPLRMRRRTIFGSNYPPGIIRLNDVVSLWEKLQREAAECARIGTSPLTGQCESCLGGSRNNSTHWPQTWLGWSPLKPRRSKATRDAWLVAGKRHLTPSLARNLICPSR